ncbi:terminase small subunit [Ruegeria phage RpAliso]|nr:terminase small subunit [Ruegeria phage RpAliso]
MPSLENPKHEEFCLLIARGVKQGEAYKRAGYAENKGAASRLAASPQIQDRIEEIRKEIDQKIQTAMTVPSEQNWQSLADMGLTYEWVAEQYKTIYSQSLAAGAFAAANSAVQSIQKMIEMERNGKASDEAETKQDINITAIGNILDKVANLVDAAKTSPPSLPDTVDITPKEESDD